MRDRRYAKQCLIYAGVAASDGDLVRVVDELVEAIKILTERKRGV